MDAAEAEKLKKIVESIGWRLAEAEESLRVLKETGPRVFGGSDVKEVALLNAARLVVAFRTARGLIVGAFPEHF